MRNLDSLDIKSQVIESIIEVFDTMVSMEVEHAEVEPEGISDVSRMVAGVNFAGNVAGILNIQVAPDFARRMTASRLDMAPEELENDGEIKELLSKISHIVADNLNSALNDAGLACSFSAPSVTQGEDFTIRSSEMERFERFVFMSGQDWIIVEVGISTQQETENGVEIAAAAESQAETEAEKAASGDETEDQAEIDADQANANAQQSQAPSNSAPQDSHPSQAPASPALEDLYLDLLLDIPLEIKVELGRAKIQIQELLRLAPGSAVKLTTLEGEPVDILANETLIARGEVVVQKEKYGIRVTEITSRLDRIRSFGL